MEPQLQTELGLYKTDALKPGKGWVGGEARLFKDTPLALSIEAGMKLTPDWSLYGTATAKPTEQEYLAGAGARFKGALDVYTNGFSTRDNWGTAVGVRYHW